MNLSRMFRLTSAWQAVRYSAVTYYEFETMTLCRLSLSLGPVAYEHCVPALTQ